MGAERSTLFGWRWVAQDWQRNRGNPKFLIFLTYFRASQALSKAPAVPRGLAWLVDLSYRLISEGVFGVELPLKTRVGSGLRIFHGFGLVVNDGAVLGSDVTLRNGVVIGHRFAGGPLPVFGNRVDVGAASIILGGIHIGDDASVGAGAVVLHDVPAGAAAVGNPARMSLKRTRDVM